MATLIGDVYGADSSPFHSHAPSSGIASRHQNLLSHQNHQQSQYSSRHHQPRQPRSPHSQDSHQMHSATSSSTATATATPHHPHSPPLSSSNSFSSPGDASRAVADSAAADSVGSATARILTPPDSSSPSSPQQTRTRDGCEMASISANAATMTASTSASSDSLDFSSTSYAPFADFPPSYILPAPPLPQEAPEHRPQRTILIRDLGHIQSLTRTDSALGGGSSLGNGLGGGLGSSGLGSLGGGAPAQDVKFEISAMPIGDIIEMVAALLTKITTTNDHQHDALHRNASQQRQAQAHNESGGEHSSAGGSPFSASVLAFHGKNVPAITILSYLSRIHKYCPTTYEVFLSLLVYFDRMTERVNELVMKQQREREREQRQPQPSPSRAQPHAPAETDPADVEMADNDGVDETDEGLADSDSSSDDDEDIEGGGPVQGTAPTSGPPASVPYSGSASASASVSGALSAATYFVVDSYNIHRLIIAGVTCASKFFSDVFYTNARYAKVGGLPLAELNHLELQFLILNDFRLAIPMEDLEAYATMLVEFYAREVVGQRPRSSPPSATQSSAAAAAASNNTRGTAAAP